MIQQDKWHDFAQNQLHINISYYEKIPKIGENALIIDFALCQNFAIFAMCSKH